MLNKKWKLVAETVLAVSIILAVFAGGFLNGAKWGYAVDVAGPITNISKPGDVKGDMSIFWQTWRVVLQKFVDRGDLNSQDLIEGAANGLVNAIDDPYSEFMNATTTQSFNEELSGSFEGIGVEITKKDGFVTIISPLRGMPAEKAGLKPGDKILKIDDKDAQNMNIMDAVKLIKGKKGTEVVLTVFSLKDSLAREVKIIRGVINVKSCEWEELPNKVALLRIYNFSQPVLSDFYKSAQEILDYKPRAIILDMRNNPGGFLNDAIEIAGWFLNNGEAVVKEDFGNGKEVKTYLAEGNAAFGQMPMAILVNDGSASASEILAGALRDVRKIKLVGVRTFGKGSVQELVPLQDGSSLKITIARWLTPNGFQIDQKGLEPDFVVEPLKDQMAGTYNEISLENDPQLKKAYDILSGN